jgi:hypothetical protein
MPADRQAKSDRIDVTDLLRDGLTPIVRLGSAALLNFTIFIGSATIFVKLARFGACGCGAREAAATAITGVMDSSSIEAGRPFGYTGAVGCRTGDFEGGWAVTKVNFVTSVGFG